VLIVSPKGFPWAVDREGTINIIFSEFFVFIEMSTSSRWFANNWIKVCRISESYLSTTSLSQ
jgi:hypothetical protein